MEFLPPVGDTGFFSQVLIMRFYNNKFAGIPSFVFWDKVDYFFLMLLRKILFTCFFIPVYACN